MFSILKAPLEGIVSTLGIVTQNNPIRRQYTENIEVPRSRKLSFPRLHEQTRIIMNSLLIMISSLSLIPGRNHHRRAAMCNNSRRSMEKCTTIRGSHSECSIMRGKQVGRKVSADRIMDAKWTTTGRPCSRRIKHQTMIEMEDACPEMN